MTHVDKVIESSYGAELVTNCPNGYTHDDNTYVQIGNADDIDLRIARAHHYLACKSIKELFMQYPKCSDTFIHHDIVLNLLNIRRRSTPLLPSIDKDTPLPTQDYDEVLPLRAKLNVATYTYSYPRIP